jgi:predicted transcriptional regulator of viral defense system
MRPQLPARQARDRRRRLSLREREIVALGNRQHGVISRRQLVDLGLGVRTIGRRLETGRLHRLHREVYAVGDPRVSVRGRWMAAVLACGEGALLSHRSAAALWGLIRPARDAVDVTSSSGRRRPGIAVHECAVYDEDRSELAGIPVTSLARTVFDLAETIDEERLIRAVEEADRLKLLRVSELEAVYARCPGRRALAPIRRLLDDLRAPVETRSPLEDRIVALCDEYELPMPATNVTVLDHEVDALWPEQRLIAEADSVAFHSHRAAFERDRERDAARQVAGYRVIRLTHRRLEREPATVADELRSLLNCGRAGS